MKKKYIIKAVAFIVIFAVLFGGLSKIMTYPADYRNYQWVAGFYEEPDESLDAVYIGSSNCYAFWNPLTAWQEYGIAVYPYATNAQPFAAAKYLIKEARKTQPDAVFIVNINTLEDNGLDISSIHHLLDYMPFSLNKLALTRYLAEVGGYSLAESMELYLPIIRYHDRWAELNPEDFQYEVDGFKGASTYSSFLDGISDISDIYITTAEEAECTPELTDLVNDLLDYCDEEQVKVVFVTVPRAESDEALVQKFNAVNSLIASRGYPILNLIDKTDEVGLDLTKDYYNRTHTNIHGAVKFTRYLSEYLIENYQFEDKRGQEAYADWDEAWFRYEQLLSPYLLEIEKDGAFVDVDLEEPEELAAKTDAETVQLLWQAVEKADGYAIYRKTGDGGFWGRIGETSALEYVDPEAVQGEAYYYTVVPYYQVDQEKYYGAFSYYGIHVVAP